jgi:hypothetical protein
MLCLFVFSSCFSTYNKWNNKIYWIMLWTCSKINKYYLCSALLFTTSFFLKVAFYIFLFTFNITLCFPSNIGQDGSWSCKVSSQETTITSTSSGRCRPLLISLLNIFPVYVNILHVLLEISKSCNAASSVINSNLLLIFSWRQNNHCIHMKWSASNNVWGTKQG